jgi:hypothetical protein
MRDLSFLFSLATAVSSLRIAWERVMCAWFHVRTTLAKRTRSTRSVFVHAGRFTCRRSMIRGFRKSAFSTMCSDLVSQDRQWFRAAMIRSFDCTLSHLQLQAVVACSIVLPVNFSERMFHVASTGCLWSYFLERVTTPGDTH